MQLVQRPVGVRSERLRSPPARGGSLAQLPSKRSTPVVLTCDRDPAWPTERAPGECGRLRDLGSPPVDGIATRAADARATSRVMKSRRNPTTSPPRRGRLAGHAGFIRAPRRLTRCWPLAHERPASRRLIQISLWHQRSRNGIRDASTAPAQAAWLSIWNRHRFPRLPSAVCGPRRRSRVPQTRAGRQCSTPLPAGGTRGMRAPWRSRRPRPSPQPSTAG